MDIDAPGTDEAGTLTDLWVSLAADQRQHGSHLLPDPNRETIREAIVRHTVTGGLLVARDADRIVGFVMFHEASGGYTQDVGRGVVENLYVVPERQGEGIGGELLSAAEARLREAGVDVVSLEVMAENEAARRFYRRHGFSPHRLELEKSLAETDTHSKDDG